MDLPSKDLLDYVKNITLLLDEIPGLQLLGFHVWAVLILMIRTVMQVSYQGYILQFCGENHPLNIYTFFLNIPIIS